MGLGEAMARRRLLHAADWRRLASPALVVALLALPDNALAQSLDFAASPSDAAATSSLAGRTVQIIALVGVLGVLPAILMMATSLPFIIIVLSILRQGAGLQQSPPNMLIMGLALALTGYVMEPVIATAWRDGVEPYFNGALAEPEAAQLIFQPFQDFMTARVDPEAIEILRASTARDGFPDQTEVRPTLLVSAFVLSEIQRAFEVGFVLLLPFLIIDLLLASVLMAMGMMMVPPIIVSLPFKIAFLVLTNAWVEIAGALVRSYQP